MKEIFANNLKRARAAKGWKQIKTAAMIGVTRQAYAAWEQRRSFPNETDLIKMAQILDITDLLGFLSNEKFDISAQLTKREKDLGRLSELQKAYEGADIKDKLAVNILLGLVDLT